MLQAPTVEDITRQFKAVFFDLDGTLFNSEPLHADALVKAAHQLNIDMTGIDPLHDFLGMPDPALYRFFVAEKRISTQLTQHNFIKAKNSHYLALCREIPISKWDEYITQGTKELLKEVKAKGLLVAIVTASELEIATSMITHSGIGIFFDHVVARGECFRSKPSPGPYLSALRHWGLKGGEAVVFEDSATGQKSAQLAGCEVIAINAHTQQTNHHLATIDNFFRLIS